MKLTFLFFFLLFCSTSNIFALDDANSTQPLTTQQIKALKEQQFKEQKEKEKRERFKQIQLYNDKLTEIESEIPEDNRWVKSYSSYLTSLEIKKNLQEIKKRIRYLNRHAKSTNERDKLNALISKENILSLQVNKLKGKENTPFLCKILLL